MAATDPNFVFFSGGCTATSAATAHNLFGSAYQGLSQLNRGEVVLVILSASGGDTRISLNPAGQATNDTSLRLQSAASLFDLPPMTVQNASQITFAREGANNPVLFWTVLTRVP